jgi:hypothetical protein
MPRTVLRAIASATALSAAMLGSVPALASAEPTVTRLTDERAVDVSADGRYILLDTGAVIDRTAGRTSEPVPGTPVDLAAASPTVLFTTGGKLYVKDAFADGPGTLVSLNASGSPIEATRGQLVRNGAEVVFVPPTTFGLHTIEVGEPKNTVRVVHATSGSASEDGRVLVFSANLAPEPRPAGLKARNAKEAVGGQLLGYSVDGGAARRLGVTKVEERLGAPSGAITCATNTAYYKTTSPTLPRFAQDGLAGGRYQLTPGTRISDTLYDTWPVTQYTDEYQDPVSGAFASILTTHGAAPVYNYPRIVNEAGTSTDLPFPTSPPSNTDPFGFARAAFPFAKGAGAILVGQPRSGAPGGTFVVEGLPTGADPVIAWQELPRAEDPLVTGQETVDATWATCEDPAPPAATDYVTITPKPAGNSAGTITTTLAPAGHIPARSVTATVSWFGLRLWSRTSTTSGVITLPAILAGIPGFKATVKVVLADGTTATTSAALRRTR